MATRNLKDKAIGLLNRTVEHVLADEKRAAKVAKAVGTVQKSKVALDSAQESALRAMGFATKRDYQEVGKSISALRRRVRHLAEKIEKR